MSERVLATSARPPAPRRVASALAFALLMLSGAGVVTWLRIWRAGRRARLERADAIVVFGAALRATGPSATLRLRTLHAAELYHRGLAPRVLCSGGVGRAGSEPAAMAALLRACDVPDDALVLDEEGVTTRATVASLASLGGGAWHRVLAVSSKFHVYRIVEEARRQGVTALPAPACRAPAPDLVTALRLLCWDARQYAREVVAVWAYRLAARPSAPSGDPGRSDSREVRA